MNLRRAASLLAFTAALAVTACSGSEGGAQKPASGSAAAINPWLADVVMGSETAPVTIVEYASTTCPHCRDFAKQVLPVIKEKYIDTGKAKYILRDFPTPPAQVAAAGVAVARCAGKDKYYEVIDDLFTTQYELFEKIQAGGDVRAELVKIGGRHGLDAAQVEACISDTKILAYIQKTVDEAPDVTATPTIIVNDVRVQNYSVAGVSAAIDKALGVAPAEAAAPAPAAPETPAQ